MKVKLAFIKMSDNYLHIYVKDMSPGAIQEINKRLYDLRTDFIDDFVSYLGKYVTDNAKDRLFPIIFNLPQGIAFQQVIEHYSDHELNKFFHPQIEVKQIATVALMDVFAHMPSTNILTISRFLEIKTDEENLLEKIYFKSIEKIKGGN